MAELRDIVVLGLGLAAIGTGQARADSNATAFDGVWDTQVSCQNLSGALGYMFEFPSQVVDGRFEGGKGDKGQPGWFQITGDIRPDGTGDLVANGLVGASQAAVGHRPVGSEYAYHITATFSPTQGSGDRVESRPCHVAFQKK